VRRLPFGVLAFLSVGVALVAPTPWLLGLFEPAPDQPPLVVHLLDRYTAAQLIFVAHVGAGGLALLVGPWQLVRGLRARRPRLHRATGYVYVTAVAVAGSAGLLMGPRAWGGLVAQLGFTTLAIVWLTTTAIGLRRILAGDRAGHRVWMTYSFALTFAAVSLRVQVPLSQVAGIPQAIAYAIIAWSSWLPNLVVVRLAQPAGQNVMRSSLPRQERNPPCDSQSSYENA
jgi:hypothetical protein